MMVKELNTTYWGKRLQDVCAKEDDILQNIGLDHDKRKQNYQANQNANAEKAYRSKGIDVSGCSARQAFKKVKGENQKYYFLEVRKCEFRAPSKINVYSYGSYKNSRKLILVLLELESGGLKGTPI